MTKVVAILGSPRKHGNCSKLLDIALESVSPDVAVERFELSSIKRLDHCRGCDGCRKQEEHLCVLQDGANDIIRSVRTCDVLVLAFPIYFFGANSLTKACVDRLFYSSEIDNDTNLLAGKHVGLIVSYGLENVFDSGAVNALQTFRDITRFCKLNLFKIAEGNGSEQDGPCARAREDARKLGGMIDTLAPTRARA